MLLLLWALHALLPVARPNFRFRIELQFRGLVFVL